MKVGVLALQGAFARHLAALESLNCSAVAVRAPEDLAGVDALVLPGGESTTLSMLLESSELFDPLSARLAAGMPAFGTCAGMILLAAEVLDGRSDQRSFNAIDISVRRNGFGRQVDSFEADLKIEALKTVEPDLDGSVVSTISPLHAVFIRAPYIDRCGPGVETLAAVDGHPVLASQGRVMVASFHPELTDDLRLHSLFLSKLQEI